MTPPAPRAWEDLEDIGGLRHPAAIRAVGLVVAEDLLDLVAAPLQAAERQAERGHGVADHVVGAVALEGDQQRSLERLGAQAEPGELRAQRRRVFGDAAV